MKAAFTSLRCVLILAIGLTGAWAERAFAQDYVLGADDVLTISVYLHPELERTVSVSAQGLVTFPPLGEIKAAGLTAKQLGDQISDKLSTYLRQTSSVTVTVSKFMSQSVFVSGAVAVPGRYGFEKIPSLMEVIGQAGGALPGADLTRVEIIRKEGDARRSFIADVANALKDPKATLPALKAGDTVVVPMGSYGPAGVPGGGVGVIGEVAKPGLYPIGGTQDLWQIIAVAGGFTPRGKLTDVRVITNEGGRQAVVKVNLKEGLEKSGKSQFLVKSGDIVFVTSSGTANFGRAWVGLVGLLVVTRSALDIVLIKEILENP